MQEGAESYTFRPSHFQSTAKILKYPGVNVRLADIFVIILLAGSCAAQQTTTLQKSFLVSETVLPDAPQSQILKTELISLHWLAGPDSTRATLVPPPSLEGTRARLTLLGEVSSRLASGSSFHAKLDEPISIDGQVLLPAGTTIEGHIESKPARRLMRPGSLFMIFDRVILPNGEIQPASLHLVSSESAAVKADSEGMLHPTISKKRVAIQLGGTALTAKLADDLAEAAGGSAVGAGTARFVGLGAAATFFALQKGREVKLNPGEKLEVEFGRTGTAVPADWKRRDLVRSHKR
jgi:hypothetical protein